MKTLTAEETEEVIDFIKYALHETMLPHQMSNKDVRWSSIRVAVKSQNLLNKLGVSQDRPKNYTLLQDEEYYKMYNEKENKKWYRRIFSL